MNQVKLKKRVPGLEAEAAVHVERIVRQNLTISPAQVEQNRKVGPAIFCPLMRFNRGLVFVADTERRLLFVIFRQGAWPGLRSLTLS